MYTYTCVDTYKEKKIDILPATNLTTFSTSICRLRLRDIHVFCLCLFCWCVWVCGNQYTNQPNARK